ncbi:MAG: hypothetical protein ACRD4Y_02955 [Candidatus Acidiferrales bacterium]
MIAGLIVGLSFLTLLQFFVSYCHSLIAESQSYELSEYAREISGVTARSARGDQFQRLLQLLAMCPESGGDMHRIHAVSAYFGMLSLVRALLHWGAPAATKWIDAERGGCAYMVAVALDRRISYSRMLVAQQAGR